MFVFDISNVTTKDVRVPYFLGIESSLNRHLVVILEVAIWYCLLGEIDAQGVLFTAKGDQVCSFFFFFFRGLRLPRTDFQVSKRTSVMPERRKEGYGVLGKSEKIGCGIIAHRAQTADIEAGSAIDAAGRGATGLESASNERR